MILAMIFVGLILVSDDNRKLNEKCEKEIVEGISETMRECRTYYRTN